MMEKALVTLSSEESKRLIAKGVAQMDKVRKAHRDGIIGFAMCSSAGYVAEEVAGITLNKCNYLCGLIHENGMCFLHPNENTRELALVRGEEKWLKWPQEDLMVFIPEMGGGDIIVKSGNILGKNGRAGVLVGCANGGEIGNYLPYLYSSGIELIVPMTLNKYQPVDIEDLASRMGVKKLASERSYGQAVGLIPLPGTVVTEIEALSGLFNVSAIPVAAGAFGNGAGTISLLLEGEAKQVEEAWESIGLIKGEQKLENGTSQCRDCVPLHETFGMRCRTRRSFTAR